MTMEQAIDTVKSTAYLEYVGETDAQYRVRTGQETSTVVKDRPVLESYPAERPAAIRRAYRYLLYALIGLLPAGIGTILFGPLAAVAAFGALRTPLDRPDHRRALVVMGLATLLVMIAIPLVFLFFLHW